MEARPALDGTGVEALTGGLGADAVIVATEAADATRLVLINLLPSAAAMLRGLGVDRILKVYPAGGLPAGLGNLAALGRNLRPVETAASEHELAALMYDAHETLTRVDPENLQRFKDVLAFLREDLARF